MRIRERNWRQLVDEFEEVLLRAVEKRLRADVPVGAYLSGGLDSSMIAAMACRLKGPAINTYTIRVDDPALDELSAASLSARHIGTKPPIVQEFRDSDALETYPQLIQAAEAPVIDTSCAALLQLARRVHACGQKVVLTGEGADEWLAGYPWYKAAKLLGMLDLVPGMRLSDVARRAYLRMNRVPQYPREMRRSLEESIGGPNAWIDSYGLLGLSKLRFYAAPMREVLKQSHPWAGLGLNLERARCWHPLNRGLWIGARVTLAGHLLQAKGDRVRCTPRWKCAIRSSTRTSLTSPRSCTPLETARIRKTNIPLRLGGRRWLPPEIAPAPPRCPSSRSRWTASTWIRSPVRRASSWAKHRLRRTGYFDIAAVHHWRKAFRPDTGRFTAASAADGLKRRSVAVVATTLASPILSTRRVVGLAHGAAPPGRGRQADEGMN